MSSKLLQRIQRCLIAFGGIILLGCVTFEFAVLQHFHYPKTSHISGKHVFTGRSLADGTNALNRAEPTKNGEFSNSEETIIDTNGNLASSKVPTVRRHDNKSTVKVVQAEKMKAIVIVASYRTGSSFVGQLFNQHRDVFYLFEPLYFSIRRGGGSQSKSKVTEDLLLCDMSSMHKENIDAWKRAKLIHQKKPDPKTLKDLQHMEGCIKKGLCFRSKSKAICTTEMCGNMTATNCNSCRAPPLSLMQNTCANAKVRVIKVIRIEDLETLKRSWSHPHIDLRIIHLVRDPRSTLLSRLRLVRRVSNVDEVISGTCERNFRIHNQYLSNDTRFDWLKGIYKLVRYEDIIENPLEYAKGLYNFLGFPDFKLSGDVVDWMKKSTSATDFHFFGTKRDTYTQKYKWRKQIPMHLVETVQRICKPMMGLLGYKPALSKAQLWSLREPLIK